MLNERVIFVNERDARVFEKKFINGQTVNFINSKEFNQKEKKLAYMLYKKCYNKNNSEENNYDIETIKKLIIKDSYLGYFDFFVNYLYDFYLSVTLYLRNLFFMFTQIKIINYEIIKIYLQTKKLKEMLRFKFGNLKNGDLIIITNNNSFSFTHEFLSDGYIIPSIYEYNNNMFRVYKHQPNYNSQTGEEYIEQLTDIYYILKQYDPFMVGTTTEEEENHLTKLIDNLYKVSKDIDKLTLIPDVADFSLNQMEYFLKYKKLLETKKIFSNKELIDINILIVKRNSMRKEYIEIREKYKKNRFDRFFNEKINLKDALSQGMTESQFKKIDIDNNGFISLSEFNTYNISI